MTAREIAFGDVNAAALAAYPGLLKQWFPNGNMAGLEFCVGDTNGSKGQSLRVHIKKGVWKDFAGGDGGSDPISLYAAVHRLGQAEAKDRLAEELGLSSGDKCSGATRSPGKAAQEAPPAWRPMLPVPVPVPSPLHPRIGRPSQVWAYRDANGRPLFLACRFDKADGGKDVLPYVYGTYGGRTDWFWKHIPKDRPLYGLDRLHARPQAQVIVTEGEKVADAAQRLLPGMVAVTWPAGGKAVHLADWSPLKDRKVFVWPDADKEGAEAAEGAYSGSRYKPGVAQLIEMAGGEARVIDPPGTAEIARRTGYPEDDVPKGWDLADAEAEGWTSEDVVAWIKEHRRPARKPTPPPQTRVCGRWATD